MAVYDSKYNGAELDDALDDALSHIQDNTIHVTSAEKEEWYNKQNALLEGGGITIEHGRYNDYISVSLIHAGTGTNSIVEGGYNSYASGNYSHAEGRYTIASGHASHAEGGGTTASGNSSHTEGLETEASNESEHASGQYNVSNQASETFGDSGNTLFSVGNGTARNARHNAFEIRQNGDIYITKDGQDVKLQDNLGSKLDQYVCDVEEDGLYFVDEEGNIGAQLTDDGFKAIGNVAVCDNVPRPERIVRLDFYTDDTLPTQKDETNPILAYGKIRANFDGVEIYKYATLEVQGASSANYPKKNWTIAFYKDAEYSKEYEFRVGNLVPHSEYVYKANWIDATHCRNIVSNRLWEQFIQARSGYPKRECEVAFDATDTDVMHRIDTGALCHVEGFPCVLYINNEFYGIGDFNIGKKRANYNLNKSSATQVQMQAEQHVNFLNFEKSTTKWEIRNPKNGTFNSVESVVAPWFASNDPTDADFKTNFPTTHDLQNAIDYLIFIEFVYADDCVDKNFQLTTWDGTKFYLLPYDLDTTFNLWWDGSKYTDPSDPSVVHSTNNVTQSAMDFWDGFLDAYRTEIVARYNELKSKGVISVDNIYNLCTELSRKYGKDLYQQEQTKWPTIPSNTQIHTSLPQILDWVDDRITWMDSHFSNNNN